MLPNRCSRTLLIGANGAGKSSLLRILAGRHFHSPSKCQILGKLCDDPCQRREVGLHLSLCWALGPYLTHILTGRPAFHDTSLGRVVKLLGERWGYTTGNASACSVNVCQGSKDALGDVTVEELLNALDSPDWSRIEMLMQVLEIEMGWRIHKLSDGQRRRVQLTLGLARKSELLLLDEVTTDLDVVARQNLLQFLKEESEERGTTLIYATHIFDGLEDWATDLVYLTDGKIQLASPLEHLSQLNALRQHKVPAPLFRLVEVWLREEFQRHMAARKAVGSPVKAGGFAAAAERTVNTGFSRGALIPTPNLTCTDAADLAAASRPVTQAQKDRLAWQMQQNGTATVCNDEGEGLFTAALPPSK